MAIVKNCRRSSGNFKPEGQDREIGFDNYIFQVEDRSNVEGLLFGNARYTDIKVSVRDFTRIYGTDPNSLKDKDVVFAFDLNKHLIGIYSAKQQ